MKRMFIGIFLMSLTVLMLELVLIRVFDVLLTPNIGYMVITCSIFAFGLAGIYRVLRPVSLDRNDIRSDLSKYSLIVAVSIIAIRPVMNLLPFDDDKITNAPILQLCSFSVMYVALIVPFFFSGLVFTTLFSVYSKKIQTLYFWDLIGAAIGCIIIIPLLYPIAPGGILYCTSAFSLFAFAVFSQQRKLLILGLIAGTVVVLIPVIKLPEYYSFKEHNPKRGVKEARIQGRVEFSHWDPISKIDIVKLGERKKHIAYDGGQQSSHFSKFDGNYKYLRDNMNDLLCEHFWNLGVITSHYLKRDTNQKVLIIGSAGGQETKAALVYGATHIDAVELVGVVVELGKHKYSEYIGNIFNHPNVNVRVGEGRSFLRASKNKYDIIQIYSNHTSSSIASGTGAMSTTYLQTADAYKEYFEHLTDNGILHINHHIYPKMVTTAALAWKRMGRNDFQKHVVVFERKGMNETLPTFLVKMTPWEKKEVEELKQLMYSKFANKKEFYELVEDPINPENSFLSCDFYSGDFPGKLAKKMKYRIMPSTDNKPYFKFIEQTHKLAKSLRLNKL